MSYELKYRSEAETDLDDIKAYYDRISPKITFNFFQDFFETVRFLEDEPGLFQIRYRDIRIAPMYRFPYGIHYIQKKQMIIILRVLHSKRYFK